MLEVASSLQYQIDAGSSSERKASPSATSYRDCPEIDWETWQHCQAVALAKLV